MKIYFSAAFLVYITALSINLISTQKIDDEIDNKFQADLRKDMEEINSIKKRSKLTACLSIVKNSLAEGNDEVKNTIDNSKFDRSNYYDKLVIIMVQNCIKNIKDTDIEKILNPENIISPVAGNANLMKLIHFDKNINSVAFTDEENLLFKEINEASQTIDTDVTLQDEEIGFMGFKLSQLGNAHYIFVLFALLLVIVIVFGGLYVLVCNKKPKKEKKNKKKNLKQE